MKNEKLHYWSFNFERLVWFERPQELKGSETAEKKSEIQEKPASIEDRSSIIKSKREAALKKIEEMRSSAQNKGEAMQKLVSALKKHATEKFDQISKEYNVQREVQGKPFESTDKAKAIEKKAEELLNKVTERIGKKDEYIKYQGNQDALEKIRVDLASGKINPEQAKEMSRPVKEQIIMDYLDQEETMKDMDPSMKDMLARFIVEGDMITLAYADLDDQVYKEDTERFFNDVENYNKTIGRQLESKLHDVVEKFLDDAPNPDVTENEKDHFKEIIIGESTLKDKFGDGTDEKADSYIKKTVDILCKRFDVRFDEKDKKKVSYTIDLEQNPPSVYTPEEFEKKVKTELAGVNFNPDKIDDYRDSVEKNNEQLKDDRGEVREGLTFVARGGKVDSWDDWSGHEAATNLMKLTNGIRRQAEKIEMVQNQKKADESTEKQRNFTMDAYYDVAEAADLKGIIEKAKAAGYTLKEDKSNPDFKNTFEGYQIIENKADGSEIKVTLSGEGEISVRWDLNKNDSNQAFSIEKKFRKTDDFKNLDLAAMAKSHKENFEKNTKRTNELQKATESVKVESVIVEFKKESDRSTLALEEFKVKNPELIMGGHVIGSLEFSNPLTGDSKTDQVTVKINGQLDKTLPLRNLNDHLKRRLDEMKGVAEHGEKNKAEITTQLNADLPKMKIPDTLTFNKVSSFEGDFTQGTERILVGSLNKTDESVSATLYVMAGKENGAEGRKYVLVEGGETILNSMDEVNQYLKENADKLAKVETKEPVKTELPPGRQSLKDKLSKVASKLWGNKIGEIKSEDLRFSNALNLFIQRLDTKRTDELDKSDSPVLTEREQANLKQAFSEAYGYKNLDKVDENEVKLISALPVKMDGKPDSTFSSVFGENLARTISIAHEVKAGPNGSILIDNKPVTAEEIKNYLPVNLQADYSRKLAGEIIEGFEEKAEDELKAQQAMAELGKAMKDPKKTEAFKKMGITELIATMAQLWKMFQEAMKSNDWQTLQDGLSDFQKGMNPVDRIKSARDEYMKKTENIKNTGELLALYSEPYGEKAKQLFGSGEKNNALPYRVQLKEVIQARFEKELGVDITTMETKSSTETRMTCLKGPNTYRIYVERDGARSFVMMEEIKTNDKGKEYGESKVPKTEVKDLSVGADNMAYILFNREQAKPTTNPIKTETDKPEAEAKPNVTVSTPKKQPTATTPKMPASKPKATPSKIDSTAKLKPTLSKAATELQVARAAYNVIDKKTKTPTDEWKAARRRLDAAEAAMKAEKKQ